jgi:polyisoprenoid-binding protein YceI
MAIRSAILALSLAWTAGAQETAWRIDPLHSGAHFSVRHMMISTVRGEFGGVNGSVVWDAKNPARSSIEATIDCTTINTGTAKRDEELKGPEFFDIKKYPVMKFKSTKVEPAGTGKLKVTGDLTINATTRQVVLNVEGPTGPVRDSRGREKIGASAAGRVNRKDFGIIWNELMDSGGFALADEVAITLDIELIRNDPPTTTTPAKGASKGQ